MATLSIQVSILTKDKTGFHVKDDGCPPWQCTVPKGEFVIEQPKEEIRQIESDKPPPNYRLYRDDEYVVLHCGRFDVSPLDDEELEYLLAVEPISTRLQEYLKPYEAKKEKLDLVIGDVVMFKMKVRPDADAPHTIIKGVIRYIGPIQGKGGTHFGIEIQEQRYRGKGTSNGDPYFRCGSKDAVFVSMNMITKKSQYPINEKPAAAAKDAITSEPTTAKSKGASDAFDSHSPLYARTDPDHQSKFKVDDRVIVKSVKDEVFNGTVKWVGTTRVRNERDKYPSVVAAVGVDVEKKIISCDRHFPGMHIDITGSRSQELFKVPFSHTRLFFPEEYGVVLHVDEYAKQQQEANALKWEAEKAKEFGISLEEYRSQREYMEKANKDKKTHHSQQTGRGQEEEGAVAGVGALKKNENEKDEMSESMMYIQTGELPSEGRRQEQERLYELARQQSQHGGSDQTGYEVINGEVKPIDNNYLHVQPYHTVPEDHQQDVNPVPEGLRRPSPKPKAYHEGEGYRSFSSYDNTDQHSPYSYQRYPDPYQRSPDLYQRYPDPYQRSPDLYQRYSDPYQRSPDPYQRSADPYQRSRGPPAGHYDSHHHRYQYPHYPGGSSDQYPPGVPPPDPHHQFTIGSMVHIDVQRGDPLYGVVKWIGTVPDYPGTIAGVEMERPLRGCTDGTWRGRRFFVCPNGKGYFFPLTALRQDTRYMDGDESEVEEKLQKEAIGNKIDEYVAAAYDPLEVEENYILQQLIQEFPDNYCVPAKKNFILERLQRRTREKFGDLNGLSDFSNAPVDSQSILTGDGTEIHIPSTMEEYPRDEDLLRANDDNITEVTDETPTPNKEVKGLTYIDVQYSHNNLRKDHQRLQESHDALTKNYQELQEENKRLTIALQKSQKENENRLQGVNQRLVQTQEELAAKQSEVAKLQNMLQKLENNWKVSYREISLTGIELGRGGWGVIWIGKFRGQRVAVKQMHELIKSEEYMELLHREINTMSQLRHPNLLQFIGAVLDHPSGNPMIITEVMDTSLRSAYERKELTTDPGCRPVILSIMRDVAVGLNYLHCLPDPIIHRDVSSANVLLESKGDKKWKTKISDFGSAKLARAANTAAAGNLVYSAPESIPVLRKMKRKQTPKMDSYSYGVLLCEVLTCHFPDVEKFETLLLQVRASSPQLHELVVLCINEEPDKRPIMSEIIVKLDRFIA